MGPTANNWGGGYGEMNTNMSSMMNTMNNMVRDNGVRSCVMCFGKYNLDDDETLFF